MKYLNIIANTLVGLVFFVFGLNGFLHFIPLPEMSGDPADFTGVMARTGFLTVVKVMEVVFGLCILIGYQRPLMYLLIMPVAVSIVLFELLIAKQPGIGILMVLLLGYLIYANRERYMPILNR